MNYEELLAARNDGKKHPVMLPIGGFYREQVDGKWRSVVDIRPELNQNIAFAKALQAECERNKTLMDKHQLHFTPVTNDEGDVTRLELELGNYQTFDQLLKDNPAVVAEKGFMDNVLMRKIGFFGGALLIVASILANLAAFHVYHKATGGNGAIVMPESVTLSTAPREPRDKEEEAFQLQQGTRVEIVDSIADKSSGKWLQVSTAGGRKAWLKAKDVEVI